MINNILALERKKLNQRKLKYNILIYNNKVTSIRLLNMAQYAAITFIYLIPFIFPKFKTDRNSRTGTRLLRKIHVWWLAWWRFFKRSFGTRYHEIYRKKQQVNHSQSKIY